MEVQSKPDDIQIEYWPPGYGQYDVATIDGVTLLGEGKTAVFMTAIDGLKVCMVVPLCDLVGAVRQLVAHVAPNEIHPKRLVVINGGKTH
jgi:hypothetical protein